MNLSINTLLEKCCQKDKYIDESIYKYTFRKVLSKG